MPNYSVALDVRPPQIDAARQFQIAAEMRRGQIAEQAQMLANARAQRGFAQEGAKQNALQLYNEARQRGDPNAAETLSGFPDLGNQVMQFRESLDQEKQRKFDQSALQAARDAQRILAIPSGPERDAAFQAELKKDLEAGELSQEDFDRYSKLGASDQLLNGIIQQALPIEKLYQENKPTVDMRNYGFYADQEKAAGRQPMPFEQWTTGASGGNRTGQTERIIERLRQENPDLSYEDAVSRARRAPRDDTMQRERLAIDAYRNDPTRPLADWRSFYGLDEGSQGAERLDKTSKRIVKKVTGKGGGNGKARDDEEVLAEARNAIKAGKSRAAVEKRLREMGIDPRGL